MAMYGQMYPKWQPLPANKANISPVETAVPGVSFNVSSWLMLKLEASKRVLEHKHSDYIHDIKWNVSQENSLIHTSRLSV